MSKALRPVPGYVWCERHGEIHEDGLDPYAYGEPEPGWEDERCQPTDHRKVYARIEETHERPRHRR